MAKLWKSVVSLIIGNGTTQLISFAFLMILVRAYNQLDYSIFKQGNLIVNTITPFLVLGIPISLSFYLPRTADPREQNRYILNAVIAMALPATMAFAALVILRNSIAGIYNNSFLASHLWAFGGIMFAETVFSFFPYCMVSLHRARHLAKVTVAFAIVRILSLVLCVYMGVSVGLLIVLLLITSMIQMGYGLIFVARRIHLYGVNLDWPTLREQIAFSLPLGISVLLYSFMVVFDNNLTALFYEPRNFAVYVNGVYNVPFIGVITGSVSAALLPKLSAIFDKDNQSSLDAVIKIWHETIIVTSLLIIPFTFVLMVLAKEVVVLLFTTTYIDSFPIFRVYTLVLLTRITYFGNLLTVAKKQTILVAASLMGVVTLFFSYVILHFTLGFDYVVWAAVLANFVLVFTMLWQIRRVFRQTLAQVYPWRATLTICAVSLGLTIAFEALKNASNLSDLYLLILCSGLTYGMAIAFSVLLVPEARRITANIFQQTLLTIANKSGKRA